MNPVNQENTQDQSTSALDRSYFKEYLRRSKGGPNSAKKEEAGVSSTDNSFLDTTANETMTATRIKAFRFSED